MAQSVNWLLAATLFLCLSGLALAAGVRVIDGDTLEVGAETIRLWGIDAPEGGQTCERAGVSYDCGAAARAALSRLVSGRAVRCEARYKDRYGRTVARCFTGGVDLGGELVRRPMQRDLFDRWLAERTLRDPRGKVPVGEAVRDYQDYCRRHGAEPGSGNAFGRAMTAIRWERGHPVRDCGRYWGIRLRERAGTGFDDDFSHLI